MENELLYAMGEVLMMELNEIENITYTQSDEPDSHKIVTKNGKCYPLVLKAIE